MKTLDEIPPVKKSELSHTGRMFLRWNKYWLACPDKEKRDKLFAQANILGHRLEEELLSKQRD